MAEKKSFSFGYLVWIALLASVATLVAVYQAGWYTAGGAESFAATKAKVAVTQALTPVCVERFKADANYDANLVALKKESSGWNRTAIIEKGAWPKFPNNVSATRSVSEACAEALYKG